MTTLYLPRNVAGSLDTRADEYCRKGKAATVPRSTEAAAVGGDPGVDSMGRPRSPGNPEQRLESHRTTTSVGSARGHRPQLAERRHAPKGGVRQLGPEHPQLVDGPPGSRIVAPVGKEHDEHVAGGIDPQFGPRPP